jgi:preprotein translocase subunit SecY
MKKKKLFRKIIFTIFIVIILRIGNYIPVAHIDQRYLINIINSNPSLKIFFNTKDLVLSIFTLGIIPSLNSSIVIQSLTSIFPYFQQLQKEEGEGGRRQIKQYTRTLTCVFAILQSLSISFSLKPFIFNWDFNICFDITLTLVTGAMIVLWLSDLITEKGIGNGSSIILALNIISTLPNTFKIIFNSGTYSSILFTFLIFTFLIIGIIYLQEGVKIIPLISSKQLLIKKSRRLNKFSYLPLRINQVGVMPIIFTSTFLSFFTIIINSIFNGLNLGTLLNYSLLFKIIYAILNFILIIVFSFFYSSLMLNPIEIARELNRMGVTIKNVRPGQQTASYLKKNLKRLTIIGSVLLAVFGTFPILGNTYGLSITSLIILISVIIETTRQIKK